MRQRVVSNADNRSARLAVTAVLLSCLAAEALFAQDATAVALDRIYREYSSQQEKPDVARLVRLDQQLRELVPYYQWQGRPWLEARYFRTEYESIGVSPGLFERDVLNYSGKLLAEAHALDPNSPFRSYTLYSTVFGAAGETSTMAPSPEAADAYVREFPAGPFIVHVYMALAHFYHDLYEVIQLEEAGQRGDYKDHCYKPYLKGTPLTEQAKAAQELGIHYYQRLLELLPGNEDEKRHLDDLREGKRTYYSFYCGD